MKKNMMLPYCTDSVIPHEDDGWFFVKLDNGDYEVLYWQNSEDQMKWYKEYKNHWDDLSDRVVAFCNVDYIDNE